MDKGSNPGVRGESGTISEHSMKEKTANALLGIDLCALCFLFVHCLVFISRGENNGSPAAMIREKAESMKYL
jgi:hypothetical protein